MLYLAYITVNILSTTALDEFMKDYEEPWVTTKIKYYIFIGIFVSTKYNISLRHLSYRIRYPSCIQQVCWNFQYSGINFNILHI